MAGTINTFLIGEHRYQVTAPFVIARLLDGRYESLDHGAVLPAATDLSCIDHLLAAGFIRRLDGSPA